jgi:tRNA pseudouridine55 synthase
MNFLVLLEKHQNAILGTLIVHILIFVWLNIQNVSFYIIQPKEKILATLDFTTTENNLIQKESKENFSNNEVIVTNAASNYDQEKDISSSQKKVLAEKVIEEVKKFEKNQFNDFGKDNPVIDNSPRENENSKDKSVNKTVNKSIKKTSNATAKYFCENRNMILQKIPSYLCDQTGKVRLTIKVNPKGEVTDCRVNNLETNTDSQCLIENAINYAKNWKFNQDFSSTQRQEGWIEFIYLSQ